MCFQHKTEEIKLQYVRKLDNQKHVLVIHQRQTLGWMLHFDETHSTDSC